MSVQGGAQDPRADMRFGENRLPDLSSDAEDVEAQRMDDSDGDISLESTDLNVEGGMTVAFKVLQPLALAPPVSFRYKRNSFDQGHLSAAGGLWAAMLT
jgi:hypothetical protein